MQSSQNVFGLNDYQFKTKRYSYKPTYLDYVIITIKTCNVYTKTREEKHVNVTLKKIIKSQAAAAAAKLLQSCLTLHDLHGLQPTRPFCSWDFPGKSTGVGCHCLLHLKPQEKTLKEEQRDNYKNKEKASNKNGNKCKFCSVTQSSLKLFATPQTAACQASVSLTTFQSLPKFMSIALVMPIRNLFECQ